jgi:hypothetical protein
MSTISATLMGGLGNQLFQIFTAMAYAIKHGLPFTFQDCSELKVGHIRKTYWKTMLKGCEPFLNPLSSIKGQMYRESGFRYKTLPEFKDSVILHGYFQSVNYFKDELPIILDILEIPDQIASIKTRFNYLFTEPICSMHFRIGDYKALPDCHPVAPYEYYQQAVKLSWCKRVLYFNEDRDEQECQAIIERLKAEFPDKTFIHAPAGTEDWEQMLLMSCCNEHIIANSTFSWWGALLGASSSVFYPVQWFGVKLRDSHNISDLVLPTWKGI